MIHMVWSNIQNAHSKLNIEHHYICTNFPQFLQRIYLRHTKATKERNKGRELKSYISAYTIVCGIFSFMIPRSIREFPV